MHENSLETIDEAIGELHLLQTLNIRSDSYLHIHLKKSQIEQ